MYIFYGIAQGIFIMFLIFVSFGTIAIALAAEGKRGKAPAFLAIKVLGFMGLLAALVTAALI